MKKLDQFTMAYVECALWSSTTGDGTPLDSIGAEVSLEALERMEADCTKFQETNAALLEQASEYQSVSHQGHDFWLTRNGHGAGFWDGDYPDPLGAALTEASKVYGECDLYVGDDGAIYIL